MSKSPSQHAAGLREKLKLAKQEYIYIFVKFLLYF